LHFKEKVYYFKRLFNEPLNQSANLKQQTDNSESFVDSANSGIESTLQLFSYNLNNGAEQELESFFLDEFDDMDDVSYT